MSLTSHTSKANQPKVIKLTPPEISKATLLEKVVCTRPMRQGKFNLSLEERYGKTLVHCYGMGGAGWTTLFGCVQKAIELFQESNVNQMRPIRIIGSGCFGLTMAIELTRLGYHVAGITTKSLYDIPSWKAAGYFALVSVKTSPEEQSRLMEIGMNTFKAYQVIDKGRHPYITKDAVKFMPAYCSKDTDAGLSDLEALGIINKREEVTLDFGNGVVHHDYLKYMTYFMNTTTIMKQLFYEVRRLGISIELKEIGSFEEVQENILFNCSGFGGKELNADKDMIPVRGHLLSLSEMAGNQHMEYMIYTTVKQGNQKEYVYLFPKNLSVTEEFPEGRECRAIIGGTFIPDADSLSPSEQEELNKKEFAKMLDRSSQFFHGRSFS